MVVCKFDFASISRFHTLHIQNFVSTLLEATLSQLSNVLFQTWFRRSLIRGRHNYRPLCLVLSLTLHHPPTGVHPAAYRSYSWIWCGTSGQSSPATAGRRPSMSTCSDTSRSKYPRKLRNPSSMSRKRHPSSRRRIKSCLTIQIRPSTGSTVRSYAAWSSIEEGPLLAFRAWHLHVWCQFIHRIIQKYLSIFLTNFPVESQFVVQLYSILLWGKFMSQPGDKQAICNVEVIQMWQLY